MDQNDSGFQNQGIQSYEEKSRLYEKVFKNTLHGVTITDKAGNILLVNEGFTKITGYALDEIIGKNPRILKSGMQTHDFYKNMWESLFQTGQWKGEIWNRRKDGTVYPEILNISSVQNEQGEITNFVAVFSEISEMKQVEKKLKESEERYRFIVDNSTDLVAILSESVEIQYISPICQQIIGYEADEMLGRDIREFIHPDDLEEAISALAKVSNLELGVFDIPTLTFRLRHKAGHYIWLESKHKPIWDKNNKLTGIITVGRNITERKLAEETLKEANQWLEQLSSLDGLTGIPNRRTFDHALMREWYRSLRSENPLSLIMVDIDYFKKYNDTYGHMQGDECLKRVAHLLEKTINRSSDVIARYGGEEFAIILPDTDEKGAAIIAEEVRRNVEASHIPHRKSTISDWVTISVGVATIIPDHTMEQNELIVHTDQALYKAKKNGRNRVEIYRPHMV